MRAVSEVAARRDDSREHEGWLSPTELSSHAGHARGHARGVRVVHAGQTCTPRIEEDGALTESRVSIGSTTEPRELFDAVAAGLGADAPTLVTLPDSSVRVPAVVLAVVLEHGRVRALAPEVVWLLAAATRYPTQGALARVLGKSPRTVHSQVSAAIGESANFRDVVADLVWRAFVPGDEPRDDTASGVHPRVRARRVRPPRLG